MTKNECPKCNGVRSFVQKQRDNPPMMSYEVEKPYNNLLDGIESILNEKSLVEIAAEKAAKSGSRKDLVEYLKARRNK